MLFLQYTYHGIPVDVQQRTVIYTEIKLNLQAVKVCFKPQIVIFRLWIYVSRKPSYCDHIVRQVNCRTWEIHTNLLIHVNLQRGRRQNI